MAEKETKNKKKVQSSAMLTTIDTKNSRNVSKAKKEPANSNSNKKAPVKSTPKASNDAKAIVKEKIEPQVKVEEQIEKKVLVQDEIKEEKAQEESQEITQEEIQAKVEELKQVLQISNQEETKEIAAKGQEALQKPKKRKLSKAYLKSPLNRVEPSFELGLNEEQLQERIDKGYINASQNIVTKSYFSIFRSNVLTLFNLINFFLGCAVLMFGNVKNALFLFIVFANMFVGIFQEIRSKITLEKMAILTAPSVDVIRNKLGQAYRTSLGVDKIVLDDIIVLKQGSQVPVDAIVVDGECDANESLLTGEQDDIHKKVNDPLYSGSTIQAGEVKCRVTAVGENSYSAKLLAEAKKFKKTKSKLMQSINWIIRIVTILIFPLGILMFFNNYAVCEGALNQTVTKTVSSIIGMIPEGLMVLTSMALAVGVYKLAKKKTLVQDLYSIETLARVDILCLDKTGTITEGSMQVESVDMKLDSVGSVENIMGNMVKALGATNATFQAFADYFKQTDEYTIVNTIPFSSARKWSAVDFGLNGKFIVGAPEFVLKSRFDEVKEDCQKYAEQGYRVLVLVTTKDNLAESINENNLDIVALIVLSDKIRENAKQTFEYFAAQGVTLKVISGDNPITVSKVAERAGLDGADKYVDAVELDTPEKIYEACDKYTIFGRVTPKQKKQLVQALKAKGYTVGMTGDGVNDVMALKEADCSIAMAAGAEASRAVAQLVLLDSDFASLPSVVGEGRRVINNIERAASLFLVKTTFSAVLTILCIIFSLEYPFEAIHLTLVSALFVGIPSFFLALEPNNQKVTGGFLGKVFKKALPAGFAISLLVFLISYTYSNIGYNVSSQVATMATYIYATVSFIVLIQVCVPFNKERLFLIAICLLLFVWAITTTFTTTLFSLVALTSNMTIKLIIALVCIIPVMLFMRVEIEAVKNLGKEVKSFFVKNIDKAKSFLSKNK